jgi:hypothetical protein
MAMERNYSNNQSNGGANNERRRTQIKEKRKAED